jgi:hypothetical protein
MAGVLLHLGSLASEMAHVTAVADEGNVGK